MIDTAAWLREQEALAWLASRIPRFADQPLTAPRKVTMPAPIPLDPKRIAFEEWLREHFKVRALDLMRKPGALKDYADPGIQFAYASWLGGIEWAPFIEHSAGGFGGV